MNSEIIFNKYGHSSIYSLISNEGNQSINLVKLINQFNQFDIYTFIPRNFMITTENGSHLFNIDMLKCSSSIILHHLQIDPNNLRYHIQIKDENNVLSKFEKMYLGERVYFNEEDLPAYQQIVNLLNIECPNYMNNPSSSTPRQKHCNTDLQSGVQIDNLMFQKFLSKQLQRTFTILTKKDKYECTLCGASSSLVIRQLLMKQPTLNEYFYDFEDEFNEFQLICDFFNFENVKMISSNMKQLLKFANDLKIEILTSTVDNYLKKYENVSKIINENNLIIQSIDNLFDLLYKINEFSIDYVKNKIIESSWISTKENVKELASFILQVVKTDFHLHSSMIDLLIELDKEANETNYLNILLPFINKKIFESFEMSMSSCAFIYKMHQKGIISKDKLIYHLKIVCNIKNEKNLYHKNDSSYFMNNIFPWFLPEIIEMNQFYGSFKYIQKEQKEFIQKFWPDKIDSYKILRDCNEPEDELTKSLRHDDVDNLQLFVSRNRIDFDVNKVPFNLFEEFVLNGNTSYLNYAAAYGSIKCFKYLLLNHAKIDEYTFKYAIFGGNIEIIKIVYQLFNNSNNDFVIKMLIETAVKKHRNDLFDWILEQKSSNCSYDLLLEIALKSVQEGNVHSIIEIIDKGFNIDYNKLIINSMENGFYKLSKLIFDIANVENNKENVFTIKSFYDSVCFDNLSIFKLSLQIFNNTNQLNYLYEAAEHECIDITQYILTNMKIEINENILQNLFLKASKNESSFIFNYLLNKFNHFVNPLFHDFKWSESILIESCKSGTFEVAKFCIDSNKNANFTQSFMTAAIFGRKELCKYFFDKSEYINYEQILANIVYLVSIDVPTFSIIIENCPYHIKEKLLNLFVQSSIQSHNTSLLNYLLKEKSPHDKALINAVLCKDLETINIILNYDSSSSFINKMTMDGTALNIAVKFNNLPIVHRLLSLPEINPDLCDSKGMTPLMNVNIQNIEMINLFFDFYGDRIIYKVKQLNHLLQKIFEKFQSNQIDSNLFIVLDRILSIQNIEVDDYFYQYKIFENIFKTENVEFIQKLLDMSHFNVNILSPLNGNTLLIDAIENSSFEIAEILINNHQININKRNNKNETALTSAVKMEQVKIINLLINDVKFDPEESLLNYAFYLADSHISDIFSNIKFLDVNYTIYDVKFKYLFSDLPKAKRKEKLFYETTLMNATQKNDIEKVDLIIHHSTFDKNRSSYKESIHISIINKSFEIFKKLLNLLDDINNYEYDNLSILQLAVKCGNVEIINEILKTKDFKPEKDDFLNAFMTTFLITNESYEIMNILINYDHEHNHFIDFSQYLPNGKSFFNSIRFHYNYKSLPNIEKIVDLLLKNGADPNLPDQSGIYPLEDAISFNTEFALSLLKSEKINLNIKMNENRGIPQKEPPMNTFLHIAAKKDSCIFKEILSKNVIDVNSENIYGETPLMIACEYSKIENIKLLFKENNLDYLHCNKKGEDALKIVFGQEVNPIQDKSKYLQQLLSGLKGK